MKGIIDKYKEVRDYILVITVVLLLGSTIKLLIISTLDVTELKIFREYIIPVSAVIVTGIFSYLIWNSNEQTRNFIKNAKLSDDYNSIIEAAKYMSVELRYNLIKCQEMYYCLKYDNEYEVLYFEQSSDYINNLSRLSKVLNNYEINALYRINSLAKEAAVLFELIGKTTESGKDINIDYKFARYMNHFESLYSKEYIDMLEKNRISVINVVEDYPGEKLEHTLVNVLGFNSMKTHFSESWKSLDEISNLTFEEFVG